MGAKKSKTIGTLLMGIRFFTLIKLVLRNGLGIRPVYLLRFLALLPTSILVEIFILIEKIKFSRAIEETVIKDPPLFIIGHWRSGTTLLHQLMALDSSFTAPTVVQTVTPEHFLFSSKYWIPILERAMPRKRPMDEVEMKPLDPMEDEWALLRMDAPTPMERLFFPSPEKEFISGTEEFIPEGKDSIKWEKCYMTFLRKITLLCRKPVISKNPFHTPRIALLNEMFPGAKFIHIVRHPFKIVPSAINMWNVVAGQNALKSGWKEPETEKTAKVVDWFWRSVNVNRSRLQENQFAEVRFEDLEKNPAAELKRVYLQLEIGFPDNMEKKIISFMEEKKDYRKNLFLLSREEKDKISGILGKYMECYGYKDQ